MLNKILYAIFRNPALVRLAKGALAVGISAACAFAAKELGNLEGEYAALLAAILTPLLLALDKFMQAWGVARS